MISTGNDIVSLNAINITRTNDPKFYSKILSTPESKLYNKQVTATIPFENFVWLLWSIKESANKYLQRLTPDLLFTPVKFEVIQFQTPNAYQPIGFDANQLTGVGFEGLSAFKAVITFGADTLYACSIIYNELICTIVHTNEDFSNTHWGIKFIEDEEYSNQSSAVREFLIENLQKISGFDKVAFSKDQHNIPVIITGNSKTFPVSLSHHEHFIAYSFQYSSI